MCKEKSKFDYEKDKCDYNNAGYCNLEPKKRCSDRIQLVKAGTKTVKDGFACLVTI